MSLKITKRLYQFQIPLFLVSLFAGIAIAEYFLNIGALTSVKNEVLQWGVIITAFTTLFAYVVLVSSNAKTIARASAPMKNRVRSLILLVVIAVFCIAALMDPVKLTGGETFNFLYANIITTIGFGMSLGTHIVFTWAAIKKLQKIPDIETLIMLICFTLEIFGDGMTMMPALLPAFSSAQSWIKLIPNMIGQRAAIAAAGMGAVILGLRALVWKEPGIIELEITPEDQ